jgi:nucleoid-associated protein EbfC
MAKGFNRPSGSGGGGMGGGMMGQLRKMQEQMLAAQSQLNGETFTATAGGGTIKVTMNGEQEYKSVEIDPEFLKDADAEMLQDMVLTAVNLAMEMYRKRQADVMGPFTGGLGGLGI